MARPKADYATTFDKLVKGMGVGKKVENTGPEIAQLIDESAGRVVRMLDVMKRAGTLRFEFVNGRSPRYTLLDGDLASTEAKMREKGIAWSQWQEVKARSTEPAPQNGKPHNGVVKSLAELSPLRKSEPRAELEIARKHRDQQAFIVEQRARFQEMGLTLPEPSPIFDAERRHELDAVVRILPYIESLEKTNERLEEQNRTIRQPMTELTEARTQLGRQKEQIERMVREKGEIKDDVQRMVDDHKKALRAKEDEIAELKGRLGTRTLDKAISAHEINEVAARIGR